MRRGGRFHSIRFPNESDEYRAARDALLDEEIALRRQTEAVAEQRRQLPLGGEVASDYALDGPDGAVHLSELFEAGRDGTIHHFWSSELFSAPTDPGVHPRHVDFIWPLWAVLDLTPEGRGTDWGPELAYR